GHRQGGRAGRGDVRPRPRRGEGGATVSRARATGGGRDRRRRRLLRDRASGRGAAGGERDRFRRVPAARSVALAARGTVGAASVAAGGGKPVLQGAGAGESVA